MRYLVISDIHGAGGALRKALAWKEKLKADRILLLGDLLYHGPRNDLPEFYSPRETAEELNAAASFLTAVRGNCDAEVDQMLLDFPITADFQLVRLNEKRKVVVTHGHLNEYQMGLRAADVLLCGHTHIATAYRDEEGVFRCNPGSVSMPKGELGPSFGMLEEERFTVYDLNGNKLLSVDFE